jgi:hypothetical protein
VTAPTRDGAQLMGLLRRLPLICTSCAAVKLALSVARVLDAVTDLTRSAAVEQTVSRCSVCGRSQAVLTLAK